MKSLKGKIATGVVAVGLLSGVGMVFADTDAGTALQNWYNGQFGTATQKVTNDTGVHAAGVLRDGVNKYNGFVTAATNSINGTKDTAIQTASGEITNAEAIHAAALDRQKQFILANIDSQFAAIWNKAQTDIDSAGVEALKYANRDLKTKTDKLGSDALDQVNTDVTAAKEKAKADLVQAIQDAKDAITLKLNTDRDATIQSINDYMDAKETAILDLIEKEKDRLVGIQKDLINAKATEIENAAKNDLQNIVNGI